MTVTHVGGCNMWSGSVIYMNKNYKTNELHKSKKAARNELSMSILQDCHPEEYTNFLFKKEYN